MYKRQNQRRISEVNRGGTGRRQLVLNGRQVVGDNARQYQIEETDGLEEAAVNCALLTFLQALCGECALYKGLIRAPPVQVVDCLLYTSSIKGKSAVEETALFCYI